MGYARVWAVTVQSFGSVRQAVLPGFGNFLETDRESHCGRGWALSWALLHSDWYSLRNEAKAGVLTRRVQQSETDWRYGRERVQKKDYLPFTYFAFPYTHYTNSTQAIQMLDHYRLSQGPPQELTLRENWLSSEVLEKFEGKVLAALN